MEAAEAVPTQRVQTGVTVYWTLPRFSVVLSVHV